MATPAGLNDATQLITFDCYGTLIDWQRGIGNALARLGIVDSETCAEIIEAYVRAEASIEQQPYQCYREVQAQALRAVAGTYRLALPGRTADILSETLPDWPPFPDTNQALKRLKTRYRLGVLSNIDRDLFEGTARHLDVTFDLVVTAQDVRSYKPAHPHFIDMLHFAGAKRSAVLHAAQSLYHDAKPARELGIPFAWINRYGQATPKDSDFVGEFASLTGLADALGV